MASLKIENVLIYDGSLREPFIGGVVIENDRITAVGDVSARTADETINGRGRALCPGFIDIHRHPDAKPFTDWTGEVELRQGITTTVAGNCGISLTPTGVPHAREQYAFDDPILGPVAENAPMMYGDYMTALEQRPLPMNMAAMIGTGAVRISLKGFSDAPFTRDEMEKAQEIIADALDKGAPGISLGLMYLPECYGTTEEFAEMLRPVGERHSLITTHIRTEGDTLVKSVEEVIEIARCAGCALEISHFKSCGMKNWRNHIHDAIRLIDRARENGQDVSCDFYPYEGGSTALTTMMPPSFVKGDMDAALKYLGTNEGVKAFRDSVAVEYPDWDNFAITLGWDRIMITGVVKEGNMRFRGLSMAEAAERFGFEDAPALAAFLMHDENGKTTMINMSMCQDDIDTVAKLPYSCIISDAIYGVTDMPHPRMYGAMPKAIREYVRERHLLTMQEAIHKMTMLPARRMALEGRGEIAPGAYADILMFDPERFSDHATFTEPRRLATGLDLMLINGCKVIENDILLTSSAGRCLRVIRKRS